MYEVEHVLSVSNKLGEGPLWYPDEERLYWVDIESNQIQRYEPRTDKHEVFQMEIPVGAVAFRKSRRVGIGYCGWLRLLGREGQRNWDFITDPGSEQTRIHASTTARWTVAVDSGRAQ